MRKVQFQNDYFYHIYNRGIDKRNIFMDEKDYIRFLRSMRELNTSKVIESLYRLNQIRRREAKLLRFETNRRSLASSDEPLVEFIAYCLNPNHFHIMVRQSAEQGITKFMHKLSTAYTKYFNNKYNRSGSLFQETYKATQVKTDEYILYLSAYINGNSEIHKIAKAKNYKWCSYPDYLGKRKGVLCQKNAILKDFKNIGEYKNLVGTIIKESQQRKSDIKKYLLE